MQISAIAAQNLSFSYQSGEILSGISFDILSGEYVGIVGTNGSGKTTLMKAILGLIEPSRGSVNIFGQPSKVFNDWHRIGYLPQKPLSLNPLFPATVSEIVSLGLLSRKKFPKRFNRADDDAVEKALRQMDILPLKDALAGELSGGQQQRVLAARAIVNEPELLILDEPNTALDAGASKKFMAAIQKLNTDKNVTVLLVTHDLVNIGNYASKLLYIDKKLIFYGSFKDVCESQNMTEYFGEYLQHLACHQHIYNKNEGGL